MTSQDLAALLGAVFGGGGLAQAVNWYRSRAPKDQTAATTTRLLIDAAGEVVVIQRVQLTELQQHVSDLEGMIKALTQENEALRQRVTDLETELQRKP